MSECPLSTRCDISNSLGLARDVRCNMVSLSLTSFVMEHRLPWGEGNSAAPAGAGRFDQAVIIDAGHRKACNIRSVSSPGATLTGEIAMREGERLAIEFVTGQRPAATVEWVGGGEAGVRFEHPIDVQPDADQPASRTAQHAARRVAVRRSPEMGRHHLRGDPAQHIGTRNAVGGRWPAAQGHISVHSD